MACETCRKMTARLKWLRNQFRDSYWTEYLIYLKNISLTLVILKTNPKTVFHFDLFFFFSYAIWFFGIATDNKAEEERQGGLQTNLVWQKDAFYNCFANACLATVLFVGDSGKIAKLQNQKLCSSISLSLSDIFINRSQVLLWKVCQCVQACRKERLRSVNHFCGLWVCSVDGSAVKMLIISNVSRGRDLNCSVIFST